MGIPDAAHILPAADKENFRSVFFLFVDAPRFDFSFF